jgi:hypothetical protein
VSANVANQKVGHPNRGLTPMTVSITLNDADKDLLGTHTLQVDIVNM